MEKFKPMMTKKAFITGINGQDGSYLAELLVKKGYEVHGMIRRSSTDETLCRLDNVIDEIHVHYGDMEDEALIYTKISEILPDEVYNLAAQSQVGISFSSPFYTGNVNATGSLRLLEAIKIFKPRCRFYQASTSELYGNCTDSLLNEDSKFHPVSPYSISKLSAYWYTRYFREVYNIFAVNGILFNHESFRRSDDFVTKKVVKQACEIFNGKRDKIKLGNLSAKRDWGYSEDYVKAMWLMLQHNVPDDFVVATGKSYSVEHFCNLVFEKLGIRISWEGEGVYRKAIADETGKTVIEVDKNFYRPMDIKHLRGDYSKAKRILGWEPSLGIKDLVEKMVDDELLFNERIK